jgi:MoaA/NifB/PqqE/SkfB family radical SAM enzyme
VPISEAEASAALVTSWHARLVDARFWLHVSRLALREGGPARAWRIFKGFVSPVGSARDGRLLRRYARIGNGYAWDLHLPTFPSRAFDAFVRGELERLETGMTGAPHAAVFAITRRCSLACAHCSEWTVLNRPEGLSSSELQATLASLLRLGIKQIFFSGGEPLARLGDLLGLVRQAGDDAQCWLFSAASSLDARTAYLLKEAGLLGVVLSLDHWKPEAHDRFRGRSGTFERVREGARHAREAGLAVALSLCSTREFTTAENLEAYRRVALEFGASFVQIVEPKPEGRYWGKDVGLSRAQRALLEDFYERLCFGSGVNPIVSYPDLIARRMGCQCAGRRYLFVDTDGTVRACPFSARSAGNLVREDPVTVLARLRAQGCPEPHTACLSMDRASTLQTSPKSTSPRRFPLDEPSRAAGLSTTV